MHQLKIVRNVRLGVKNLLLHKLRSLLTVLGLVFGVASVVAMLSVGEGASKEAMEQIRKLGSNNIILSSVKPASTDQPGRRVSMLTIYGLKYRDAQRIRDTIPHIVRVVPVKILSKNAYLGDVKMESRVVGTTPDWFRLVPRKILAGRSLTKEDLALYSNVCVLTEKGARKLLATHHTVGQSVQIGDELFTVVGIVKSEPGGERSPDMESDIYIPMSTCRERFGEIEVRRESGSMSRKMVELARIFVQVDNTKHVEATSDALQRMLMNFHEQEDYHIYVPLALLREAQATRRRFNIVLGSIAGISLLVGGIGIMNIMLATVTERTREIGIRRAIGAKRRQIVGQFLIETVVLSTIGGLIGIGVGVMIPRLVTHFAGMPTVIPMYGIVLSLVISMAVGILFGIYPAMRAAMLNPIEALRHE